MSILILSLQNALPDTIATQVSAWVVNAVTTTLAVGSQVDGIATQPFTFRDCYCTDTRFCFSTCEMPASLTADSFRSIQIDNPSSTTLWIY